MSEPEQPAAAVVLTKVAVPEALAAACAIGKVRVDVVGTPIGAVAVCRDTAPGEPQLVAEIVSRLLQRTPVVLLERRAGQVTASRWASGSKAEDLLAALMLDGLPADVEGVLLGTTDVTDLPDVVSSVGMSRWRATRVLARAARPGRGAN